MMLDLWARIGQNLLGSSLGRFSPVNRHPLCVAAVKFVGNRSWLISQWMSMVWARPRSSHKFCLSHPWTQRIHQLSQLRVSPWWKCLVPWIRRLKIVILIRMTAGDWDWSVCVCVGRGHFFGSKWRQGWDWSGQFQDLLQDPAGMVRMQMLLLPLVASIAGLFASFGPEMLGPLGPCHSCGPWCPDNVWHGRLGKAERPPFWTFASNPIWVNYNDLTATSLESWLIREIIPKWP